MNVNATIDGDAVVIVGMSIEKYRVFIAYVDAQGGSGNLKIKEIPISGLTPGNDITIGVSAVHN
jgi:hypothetical protein